MATTVPEPAPAAAPPVKPARLIRSSDPGIVFRQRFTPATANLEFLSCAEFELPPGSTSQAFCLPRQESLLFQWEGESLVSVEGKDYHLRPYDTLYVPRGAEFALAHASGEFAKLVQCSAPAETPHPVHHSRFQEISQREDRIRRLKGKDVYLMFDVTEAADKLVAGYTFFRPFQRSWPPHNHTDQEEVYFFLQGEGAMEVYESPETLSFVHSVKKGDLVTIPFRNYHPVFSQQSPLEFIWCIAGERYWIGDKNKEFLKGVGGPITT
ncbi:MAG: 5-deoxy-glucuronate isomerase [Bryobacteraceae bacterium]|nr:5-deoxy-glucuronate isomerase [Bryobacteraceae bacterium]MDW8376931.1 5-deoxy-glucuronate isomerase [Bryobacterales bacterium]